MTQDTDSRLGRRDLLKRGALLGGAVVWTTPVIQSIGGAALATTGSGCGCMTGGGHGNHPHDGDLTAIYKGVPGTITLGLGKICCGSDKTTMEINFHPNSGSRGAASFHFTTILTLTCTTTGNPAPPPSTAKGPNHFEGTATNSDGDHIFFGFEDNGEPGTADQAALTITDAHGGVLTASGFTGGNLQAHKDKC